jgi:CDP-diacylglycerol--serine O-phosphatidyltransferase
MSGRNSPPGWHIVDAVAAEADRRWDSSVGMGMLERLNGADYLSLVALLFAWSSAVLLLRGEPNWAIVVMLGAFLFDKLDGYYARTMGVSSPFGRQIDSFIDVFAYLVTAALLYHVALSPSPWLTVVVGFVVVAFGGLRLVRHASEGFGEDDGTSYYLGITVVHVNLLVVANYFAATFVGFWNGWLAAPLIVAACPLMVSGYKSYKTDYGHAAAALASLLVAGLCVVLELAGSGVALPV